jgi:hypothetical protein
VFSVNSPPLLERLERFAESSFSNLTKVENCILTRRCIEDRRAGQSDTCAQGNYPLLRARGPSAPTPEAGENVADCNEGYVGRIRLIKELQDQCFFPLSVIKKILKYGKDSPERDWFLQLYAGCFRPVDQLPPTEMAVEEEFRERLPAWVGDGWPGLRNGKS